VDEKFKDAFERLKAAEEDEPLYSQSLGEFMASHTPADYLINGLLRRGWLYGCTALGTTGKTAMAQLLTKLITQDQRPAFFGPHEVEHGKVAYFAGENPDDLRERFIADLDLSPGITVPNDAVRVFPLLFNAESAYVHVELELEKMGGAKTGCAVSNSSQSRFAPSLSPAARFALPRASLCRRSACGSSPRRRRILPPKPAELVATRCWKRSLKIRSSLLPSWLSSVAGAAAAPRYSALLRH
jgi:hypothetical protein